jgi:hypothetical protein
VEINKEKHIFKDVYMYFICAVEVWSLHTP